MYQAFTYGPYAYNYTYTLFLESDSTFSISHRLENCGELQVVIGLTIHTTSSPSVTAEPGLVWNWNFPSTPPLKTITTR